MSERDAVESIHRFNEGREPERLALKYERMAVDPFVFFRGTAHLFYEDLPLAEKIFSQAPVAWICGDLHLENFGTYKGDNRQTYFDLNDFDEGCLAPSTWDIARFVTSLWLAADQIGLKPKQRVALEDVFLNAYIEALADGKARWVERSTAAGMVGELLSDLPSRKEFLDSRTRIGRDGRRRLRLQAGRSLPVNGEEGQALRDWLNSFAERQPQPAFYELLDMARRVAGTGSLGAGRYVLLVEGRGSPDSNFLLDLKQALPASLQPRLTLPQPAWGNPAVRAVTVQQRMQAITPALLQPVQFGGSGWVLRELQPSSSRLALSAWNGRLSRLEEVLRSMGALVAWAQLRSSGREGSAPADALIGSASRPRWRVPLIDYARAYALLVEQDWRRFCEARERPADAPRPRKKPLPSTARKVK